jgi:hypothetical protein
MSFEPAPKSMSLYLENIVKIHDILFQLITVNCNAYDWNMTPVALDIIKKFSEVISSFIFSVPKRRGLHIPLKHL